MTTRVRRSKHFDISVRIGDTFIRTPRDSQRNWVLNRAIKEFSDELTHLDQLAQTFIRGSDALGPSDRARAELTDTDIMEDWQIPIMQEMARAVAAPQRDVLEVGFGRGIASSFIQEFNVNSHTIVECNEFVVKKFEVWVQDYEDRDIRMVRGRWQDVVDQLDSYDAIFFHTYPLDEEEFVEQVVQSETFADNFFAVAARLLRDQGRFTYFTNEIDSLGRGHQRLLLKYFRSFEVQPIRNLKIPQDTKDALWSDSMIIVTVKK